MQPARRILLVEDDPDEAKRARDVLADSGYLVRVASTAQGARLAAVQEAPFDLVFLDLRLPDGDGLGLVPALRRAGVRAPVVLLTGDASERSSQAAFRAGCADFAVKDLNYHLWLPAMAQALIATSDEGEAFWGTHVLGICLGRMRSETVQAEPPGLWSNLAPTMQAAAELAIKGVRASGESLLGSVPVVHVRLPGRHLLFLLRGGTFGAAVLERAPEEEDQAELLSLVMAYALLRRSDDEAHGAGPGPGPDAMR